MKINANMSALVTNRQLLHIEERMSASMERLSTGFKINHAKDNPAGMAISNKMRAQIAALDRASNNASDAIAAVHIADGALNEMTSILQRMRELAVQAANDTNTPEDRQAIQQEIVSLREEIDHISQDTEYNEMPMLDGSMCNRVYAENISRISTTDEVAAGIYKLEVTSAAEKAEIGTALNVDRTGTTAVEAEGTISINGYSIEINKDDTGAEIFGKIREAAEHSGAELDENGILMSNEYGSNVSLKLSFSSIELAEKLGYGNDVVLDADGNYVYGQNNGDKIIVPKGSDAKVELDETSSFSDTATVTTDGNRVRITDKYGFEMDFLIDDNVAGELSLEVTNIGTMTIHTGANKDQNMIINIPEVSCKSLYIDKVDVTAPASYTGQENQLFNVHAIGNLCASTQQSVCARFICCR